MLVEVKEKLNKDSKGINKIKGSIMELETKLEGLKKKADEHEDKMAIMEKKVNIY